MTHDWPTRPWCPHVATSTLLLCPKDHAVRSPGTRGGLWLGFLLSICLPGAAAWASEPSTPEEVLRTLVRANADKDIPTMSRWMAHDEDCINYTIGGRKYVGWNELAKDLQEEFEAVAHLDIPIRELQVWTRGQIAWFVMEIDYMRYSGQGPNQQLHLLPLRETGVLERRNGNWILVAWHESLSNPGLDVRRAEQEPAAESRPK